MSKINIVQISAALGFPVTAHFIIDVLGVPPDTTLSVKRALFWHSEQYGMIHGRLQYHLNRRIGIDPLTFTPDRPKAATAADSTPATAAGVEPEAFGFEMSDDAQSPATGAEVTEDFF